MDFIYGEICQKALANEYKGGKTTTSETSIIDNTIFVNAHVDSEYLDEKIKAAIAELKFEDTIEEHKFIVMVKEKDGVISVGKKMIEVGDVPGDIPMSKIKDLDTSLSEIDKELLDINTKIAFEILN